MESKLTLHNDISEVSLLAEWLDTVTEEFGLPMTASFQLNLALEEAVVNVMNYAFPGETGRTFTLTAEKENADPATPVVFSMTDTGVPFDPTQADEPDVTLDAEERPIGGLGIFLIRQIMQSVTYQRKNDSNILTMTYVPTEGAADLSALLEE